MGIRGLIADVSIVPPASVRLFRIGHGSRQISVTYSGFDPSVSPERAKECIGHFSEFDTRIAELSRAYRPQPGTGWYMPAGVVHAPGYPVTYEPQWNSDVNPEHLLTDCTPDDEKNEAESIFNQTDWAPAF